MTGSVAQIQVINNGTRSNVVTVFTSQTSPGVLTLPAGGIGYAAAQHLDYTTVTPTKPAQIGETIVVYTVGLGDVTPPVPEGTPTPSDHQTQTTLPINVFIDSQPATVGFAGLTPTAIGLYQLNVTVPNGVSTGDVYLDVSGPDSYTSQALISIAPGSAASLAPMASPQVKRQSPLHRRPHTRMPRASSRRVLPQ
jgi:uncharacterized protein (TIGR03437 family)